MPRKPPLGLARTLRDDLYKVTAGQPMKWIMVGELGLRHPDTRPADARRGSGAGDREGLDDGRGGAGP